MITATLAAEVILVYQCWVEEKKEEGVVTLVMFTLYNFWWWSNNNDDGHTCGRKVGKLNGPHHLEWHGGMLPCL